MSLEVNSSDLSHKGSLRLAARERGLQNQTHERSSGTTTLSSATHSRPSSPRVLETSRVEKEYDPQTGHKMINHYEIIKEIGRGVHGKVKLGRDTNTNELVAIKIVLKKARTRLGKTQIYEEAKVRHEVAIMKKLQHQNVVKLREVMDDPTSKKIYLVLEYMEGGEIIWQTNDGKPALTVEQARRVLRDVVLGLEYLHYNGIIHRDIKPANLLWTKNHCVKISDFGVSHISVQASSTGAADLELAKTAGSPAFFAPELCWTLADEPRPAITFLIDNWALGITMFCLLYGHLPFTGSNEFVLFHNICEEPLTIPSDPPQDPDALDLLKRLLEKHPEKRITLSEVKRHPFILKGLHHPKEWLDATDPKQYSAVLQASPDDVAKAFSLVDQLKKKLWKLSMGLGLGRLERFASLNEARRSQ